MAGIKGMSSGEKNGRAKLSESQVKKLLAYRAEGWTLSQLAARFGIARSTACDIVNARRWTHLEAA